MGNGVCALCEPGTFTASMSGSTACVDFPVNTFSSIAGAATSSACVACPLGRMGSVTRATSIATCLCPANNYSTPTGDACVGCPTGMTSNAGATSIAACRCPANSYAVKSGDACVACPANSFAKAGATSATDCVLPTATCGAGTTAMGGASAWACCAAGTFGAVAGCAGVCPAGTYGVKAGGTSEATACAPCPPGSVSHAGNASCGACLGGRALSGIACIACTASDPCAPGGAADAVAFDTLLPPPPPTEAAPYESAFLGVYLAGACVAITTATFFGAALIPVRVARALDVFAFDHWIPECTPLEKRTSRRGAACSVSFAIAAASIAAYLIAAYASDNVLATSALVPIATLPAAATTTPSLQLSVRYADTGVAASVGGGNACAGRNGTLFISGVTVSGTTTSAATAGDGSCTRTWVWSGVTLQPTATLTLAHPAWLAQRLQWSLTSGGNTPVRNTTAATSKTRLVGVSSFTVAATPTRTIGATNGVAVATAGVLLAGLSSSISSDDGSAIRASDVVTLAIVLQVRAAPRTRQQPPRCAPRARA